MSQDWDRALLRRFEPVLRFSQHERFFPLDVVSYVKECSLWVHYPGREPEMLLPKGAVTLEKLGEIHSHGFHGLPYLKFIEPMSPARLAAYRLTQVRRELAEGRRRKRFRAQTGRLARVGYLSRLVDAAFSITLLTRGRVTGDTAAAAGFAYERLLDRGASHVYYGRVVRQGGWTALQYWFFYAFNDWRSGFYGANDHEADWESVFIYLWEDEGGDLKPEWIACATHDDAGDDLRRRWDDPELEKIGNHPVVYAAAGSHANYYRPGEYLAELKLPFLDSAGRVLDMARRIPQSVLGHQRGGEWRKPREFFIRVPFIDYAAADGPAIGPGQLRQWSEPGLLAPLPPWASYTGLWGYFARDPASGEDAPAGPLYNRDGTMRLAWYDPVGWSGLNKVLPPGRESEAYREARSRAEKADEALRKEAEQEEEALVNMTVETHAMQGHPRLKDAFTAHQVKIKEKTMAVGEIHRRIASNKALLEAICRKIERIEAGERPSPRAHLQRPHVPASDLDLRLGRLAEAWAAISVGLAVIGVVVLMLFAREHLREGLAILAFTLVAVEAGFRRRLRRLIDGLTIALAVACAIVILYEFLWEILMVGVLLVSAHLLVQNLRELWRR